PSDTFLRTAASLLSELTINPRSARSGGLASAMMVHTLARYPGEWRLTAGGDYQQVRPGIYDLFDTTSMVISPIPENELFQLLCPFCQMLLFGPDAAPCPHQFLRLTSIGQWAPQVVKLIEELNRQMQSSYSLKGDFKKFLLTNPQLDWQRFT